MAISKNVRLSNFLSEFEEMFKLLSDEQQCEEFDNAYIDFINEQFAGCKEQLPVDFMLDNVDNVISEAEMEVNDGRN